MRKALWFIIFVAIVVVIPTALFSTGRYLSPHATSTRTPAPPLPAATTVAGSADPVRAIPGRPVRIRVELDSTASTADISFSVRSTGDSSKPAELDGHALPWAAELTAPDNADYLNVTGYVADRDTVHQIRCRILVGGVVVETRQGASYASCTLGLGDLGG